MNNPQVLISVGVVAFTVFLLIKMVGLKFFSKAIVLAGIGLTLFFMQQSQLPKKNLAAYMPLCHHYTGPRYSALHLKSKRKLYIFTNSTTESLHTEACVIADNGKNWVFHWYSMTLRNPLDVNDPEALDKMSNSKSKISVNGSYGQYEIFSPTTLPLFHASIKSYKDNNGYFTLQTGYTYDRAVFVSRF